MIRGTPCTTASGQDISFMVEEVCAWTDAYWVHWLYRTLTNQKRRPNGFLEDTADASVPVMAQQ